MSKIKLTDVDHYEPSTFEEWVAIHGEPEYLYEPISSPIERFSVDYIEHEPVKTVVDFSYAFIESKNGVKLNYPDFVYAFIKATNCVYCNGVFYTPAGMMDNGIIRKKINEALVANHWEGRLDTPVNALFATLKDMAYVKQLPVDQTIIPFANGDLHLNKNKWEFHHNQKLQTPYRLPVDFVNEDKSMPLFQKWLDDVFDKEDQKTIQQMLGYCLVPVTAAQEAFFIVGEGGIGKSVMGVILNAIFGNSCRTMTTQELVGQRFQLSTAENKLVMYDDDLGSGALTETATLKKLITADQKIPAERKYGDPYEFQPYCKIVACANFMLSSLYDDSDGFFRRLHPIQVLPKQEGRKVIKEFGKLIVNSEAEAIVRWALKGLKEVMENGWEIHWSQRSKDYLDNTKSSNVSYNDFVEEVAEYEGDVTSSELYETYKLWCRNNTITPVTAKRLINWFNDHQNTLGIRYSTNIKRNNKHLRGYQGISIKNIWKEIIPI